MNQNNKVVINNSYTRLKTKGKYCDKDIVIVLENAANIVPENIKEGVVIAGVTGTLQPAAVEECKCDVESIDKTIDEIDVTPYENGTIIYSKKDSAVYKKINGVWELLNTPIVPVIEIGNDFTNAQGYTPGTIIYDEIKKNFFKLTITEEQTYKWEMLRLPVLLENDTPIKPKHSTQTIDLNYFKEQDEYDGLSHIVIDGVTIPDVVDHRIIEQVDGENLNNTLVYSKKDNQIYKLRKNISGKYYNYELYHKDHIPASAELTFNGKYSGSKKLGDIFKDKFKPTNQSLDSESTISFTITTPDTNITTEDITIDPDFSDVINDISDKTNTFYNKVTVPSVSVVNWTNYVKLPVNPKAGNKYYLKPDDYHGVGLKINYTGELNGVVWTVGRTYEWDGTNWLEVLPIKEYTYNEPFTSNSGDGYEEIPMPSGYGMSKVKFKVNVSKGDSAVPDNSYNTEDKALEPRHDSFSITKNKGTDGFGTVWIKGVKAINVTELPKNYEGFANGDLINLLNPEDISDPTKGTLYVFNGTEFVEYVLDEYEYKDENGELINLIEGPNPIEIPNSQVAKKVIVNVKSSELYDVDKTYNTTPVKLKHTSETLTPKVGTVGFQRVTLPGVTILEIDGVEEDGDASAYKNGTYVSKKGTPEVYKVVDGKFKNVVLSNWNATDNVIKKFDEDTIIPIPENVVGTKSITVKTRPLNLTESLNNNASHKGLTITPGDNIDGLKRVTVKPQNVINTDNAEFAKNAPTNINYMYYLTKDSSAYINGSTKPFQPGVYQYSETVHEWVLLSYNLDGDKTFLDTYTKGTKDNPIKLSKSDSIILGDGLYYYKQMILNYELQPGQIKDVENLLTLPTVENEAVYLTKEYTEQDGTIRHIGLYKAVKTGQILKWVKIPDKFIDKDVELLETEQTITTEIDENGNYIGLKDVYIPASYMRTWTDSEKTPNFNDMQGTTTGRFYFMPKGASENSPYLSMTIYNSTEIDKDTNDYYCDSGTWYADNVYEYTIAGTQILWEQIKLVAEDNTVKSIKMYDDVPDDITQPNKDFPLNTVIYVKPEYQGTEGTYYKFVYTNGEDTKDGYSWKQLIIEDEVQIPSINYDHIKENINSNHYWIHKSIHKNWPNPFDEVDIEVNIPEADVKISPNVRANNIKITPNTLKTGAYGVDYTIREVIDDVTGENKVKVNDDLSNVLIGSITIDTTTVPKNLQLAQADIKDYSWEDDIVPIPQGKDGFDDIVVRGVTVVDKDTLPNAATITEDMVGKRIFAKNKQKVYIAEKKGDSYVWTEKDATLGKSQNSVEPKWKPQTVTPDKLSVNADGLSEVTIDSSHVQKFDNENKIPNPSEEYIGKIAMIVDENDNPIRFKQCTLAPNGSYIWYEIKPIVEYTPGLTITKNGPHTIDAPAGYGMSKVTFDIQKTPEHDNRFNILENGITIKPSYERQDFTPSDGTDGFGNIYVEGVLVKPVDTIPTVNLDQWYKTGDLISCGGIIYKYDGKEFINYIKQSHFETVYGFGSHTFDIPNGQATKKVTVTVSGVDSYMLDTRYEPEIGNEIYVPKHSQDTVRAINKYGLSCVTIDGVTVIDLPGVDDGADANGYNEGVYACNPESKEIYVVVKTDNGNKWKNIVVNELDFSTNSTNDLEPDSVQSFGITGTFKGMRTVKVKARALRLKDDLSVKSSYDVQTINISNYVDGDGKPYDGFSTITVEPMEIKLQEKEGISKHPGIENVIKPDANQDGLSQVTILPQNVINTTNPNDLTTEPENHEYMYYVPHSLISDNGEEIEQGVYKYYTRYDEDGEEVMYTSNVFYLDENKDGALSSIEETISMNPTAVQNLLFKSTILIYNRDDLRATVYFECQNCKFEIVDGDWYLTNTTGLDLKSVTTNDLTNNEIKEYIYDIPGFSKNGINLKFIKNPNGKGLVWDSENETHVENNKLISNDTQNSYNNYYLLQNTYLLDQRQQFGGDFRFNYNQTNDYQYSQFPKVSTGWHKLIEKDYSLKDEYVVTAPITKNGTYTFPEVTNNKHYKSFTFTTDIKTGKINDVTVLQDIEKEGTIVYLTTLDNDYTPGLYKSVKENNKYYWQRLPDTLKEKEVVSNTEWTEIKLELNNANNTYSAYSKIDVPAYYIKTWTNTDRTPMGDELDNTTGILYFKPKGYENEKSIDGMYVYTTTTGQYTTGSWRVGRIYEYNISNGNITWTQIELVKYVEHVCSIPEVNELPVNPSLGDRYLYVGEDYNIGSISIESNNIYEFADIENIGPTWEKMVLKSEVKIPIPEKLWDTDVIANNQTIHSEEGLYEKFEARIKIPEVNVTYQPTTADIITITPFDLSQNKYNYEFVNDSEDLATDTFENVLIKSVTVDTTNVKTKPNLQDITVELTWDEITYDPSMLSNVDGFGKVTVPSVSVVDMEELPDAAGIAGVYGPGVMICVKDKIYKLVEQKETPDTPSQFKWILKEASLMENIPVLKYSWDNEIITPASFGSYNDGFKALKIQNSVIQEVYGDGQLSTYEPSSYYDGKIAMVMNPEDNTIQNFFQCGKTTDGYDWQVLRRTYTDTESKSANTITIKPTSEVVKLSDVVELKDYEAVDINKIEIAAVSTPDVPTVQNLPNAEEYYKSNAKTKFVYYKGNVWKCINYNGSYQWATMGALLEANLNMTSDSNAVGELMDSQYPGSIESFAGITSDSIINKN